MGSSTNLDTTPDDGETDQVTEWTTPDDFRVRFDAADLGVRFTAVLLDAFILIMALLVPYIALRSTGALAVPIVIVAFLVGSFLIWNGYWIWFEWRWRGQTPGKYLTGVRVIRAGGGSLKLSSIVARNLVREAEFWMPLRLSIALMSGAFESGHLFLWTFGFLLIPFFSSTNRRLGDFLAGTVVVKTIRNVTLREDLIDASPSDRSEQAFVFTRDMLDVYGVVQLNALKDVLDQHLFASEDTDNRADREQILLDIKRRMVQKIDYPQPVPDDKAVPFLKAFYRSMRSYLEGQLASGRSTRDDIKQDTDGRRRSQHVDQLAEQYRLPDTEESS